MLPSIQIKRIYPSTRLFDAFFDDLFEFPAFQIDGDTKPPIHDVIENDKEFIIEAMMAGVKKEDVSIEIVNDVLVLKAERKSVKDLNYNRKESFFGTYQRYFKLIDTADIEKITATLIDGVLRVVIPKLEKPATPAKKKIEIG
jgi:HSP20 family protein